MANRVKCKECLGCMAARWIDNSRYYYCDLCKIWYGGKELVVVPNPYEGRNLPKEIKEKENEAKN